MEITFGDVCELLEEVERIITHQPRATPERERKKVESCVKAWFLKNRSAVNRTFTNGGAFLSILLPHLRKDRVYGFQVPSLARKITKLLNLNYAQQAIYNGWQQGVHGDLGIYVEKAMRPWNNTWNHKNPVPLTRVDVLLTQLAAKSRFSDAGTRQQRNRHFQTDKELKRIFVQLESWEAKWFTRLLLRDYCTLDLDERLIYFQYHFLAPDLLKFQNDFDAATDLLSGELSCFPPVPPAGSEQDMRIEAAKKLKAVVGIKVSRPPFYKAWSFKHCFDMMGDRAWAAEVKYDGEYCEIHVDLENPRSCIQIFSKNGKDASKDRSALRGVIKKALGLDSPDCSIKRNCILLGEMVIYSDKEQKILPFSKIRKHVSRSGSFLGTEQDSLPHAWEHFMVVFFDVLVLDDEPVLRYSLQERRRILREITTNIPGRSMRSAWTLLDFKTSDGITDLKQVFASSLAKCQEGLVLKPLHSPYFPLHIENGDRQPGFFVKLKKDYLGDMGGARDFGDFAVVGASYDPQVAAKSDVKPLHWTHFYLGCLQNKAALERTGEKPNFKIVGVLSLHKCIPKRDLKYLNVQGRLRERELNKDGSTEHFIFEQSNGYQSGMSIAFTKPFIAEILGGGYEKMPNETFEMLRHPRLTKIHHDRTWEDSATIEDLDRMAQDKWNIPEASDLDGHAKDVALLVQKYAKTRRIDADVGRNEQRGHSLTPRMPLETSYMTLEDREAPLNESLDTLSTTTKTSQHSLNTVAEISQHESRDSLNTIVETPQHESASTLSTIYTNCSSSTQNAGIGASRQDCSTACEEPGVSRNDNRVAVSITTTPKISGCHKRVFDATIITPPPLKRRRARSPLKDTSSNRSRNSLDCESQDKTNDFGPEQG